MNPIELKNYTYGVYARKSSESEDKQVQSIDRQIDDFLELQEREKLTFFDEPIKESKSAFSVGREGFNFLVKLTESGKINAWLCWHANRLSRNAIDAGVIVDLLDRGKLHHIRTPTRIYFNTPTDKMMLQIEFTMSKKDSDDKSVFVKSGLKKRYKKGLPNGKAPIGFLNDKTQEKGNRDWLVDKPRFDKLKLLFTKFLKGNDSLNSITAYAREILKLTTVKTKKQGGKLVGRSMVEHILKNPVYAGFFYSKDEYGENRTMRQLDKKTPRILTENEHFNILNIFGDRNHPNQQSHLTPYSGVIKGKEGNYMGADVKLQVICDCTKKFAYRSKKVCPGCNIKIIEMKNPKYLSYTYYYNIKRKRTKGLSARSIEEQKINQALIELFENELQISEAFYTWSKLHLNELRDNELEEDKQLAKIQHTELNSLRAKKERLRELFMDQIITKEEFQNDLKKLEKLITLKKESCEYAENWYEHLEELLDTLFNFDKINEKGVKVFKPKEEWIFHMVEPIISEEIWDKVNHIITTQLKSHVQPLNTKVRLFTRYVFCSCGGKMVTRNSSKNYICMDKCGNRIHKEDLEEVFRSELHNYTVKQENVASYFGKLQETVVEKQRQLDGLVKEKKKINTKIEKLLELHSTGQIETDSFKDYHQKPYERLSQVQETIAEIEGEISGFSNQENVTQLILEEAKNLYEKWDTLSHEQKRNIIEIITENIIVGNKDITINLYKIIPDGAMPHSSELAANGVYNQ